MVHNNSFTRCLLVLLGRWRNSTQKCYTTDRIETVFLGILETTTYVKCNIDVIHSFFWHSSKLFLACCIVQFNNKTWSNAMFTDVTSIQYRPFLWHQHAKKKRRTIRFCIRRSFILHESTGKCFRYIGYWKALNKKWKGKWRGVKNEGYLGTPHVTCLFL